MILPAHRMNDDMFSVVIQPGETYSKTYMTAGIHPYFLASKPAQVGTIIVEDTVQSAVTSPRIRPGHMQPTWSSARSRFNRG